MDWLVTFHRWFSTHHIDFGMNYTYQTSSTNPLGATFPMATQTKCFKWLCDGHCIPFENKLLRLNQYTCNCLRFRCFFLFVLFVALRAVCSCVFFSWSLSTMSSWQSWRRRWSWMHAIWMWVSYLPAVSTCTSAKHRAVPTSTLCQETV